MADQHPAQCDDERPVPPLGYCAECLRGGIWVRAAALWDGTGLCAQDLVFHAGVTEGFREDAQDRDLEPTRAALDSLRRGMHSKGRTAAF